MATLASIAVRTQRAQERINAVATAIFSRVGGELPPPPARVSQPELRVAMELERLAEVLERIEFGVGETLTENAATGIDPTALNGSVTEVTARVAEMTDADALRFLRSAEAGKEKPRTTLLAAMDKRIEALEVEAAEAQTDQEEAE